MSTSVDVVDDAFVVDMDGARARLDFEVEDGRLLLLHTEVPEQFQGHGVGGRLVTAAVEKARAEGLTIVPWCPYARRWLKEHPEQVAGVNIDFASPPPLA
jgi:predicted GNAT family acetyltransferase